MTRKSQPSGLRGWRLATRNPIAAHGTPMTSATTPSPTRWANTDSGIMAASDAAATPPSTTDQPLLLMMASVGPDRSGNVTARRAPAGEFTRLICPQRSLLRRYASAIANLPSRQ